MPKTPLTERMEKAKAPKTWIREVQTKDNRIERLLEQLETFLNVIDRLAREKEQLEADLEERTKQFHLAEVKVMSREAIIEQLSESELAKDVTRLEAENEYLYRHAEEGGMDTDKFFEFTEALLTGVDDDAK